MDTIPNKLDVDLKYLPIINFAMQQNSVSVLRDLFVENLTDTTLSNIKIQFELNPTFGSLSSTPIQVIHPRDKIRIQLPELKLSPAYLAELTEHFLGNINLKVYSDEDVLFEDNYPIDILTYDQWGGLTVLPQMLSSFVTPNHPALQPIIQRASEILELWTGNPSLDEYQSRNPDRVRKQMAAIYIAITEQQIVYSSIPASFEEYGQRIRLVDAVLSQRMGTCLDMSLLYASCLEAIGIHSLLIIIQGHAFAGGWLVPETFPDSVVDDVSLLSKRIADGINDITLVETTCMNKSNNIDFDTAVSYANNKLLNNQFILAIDVKRARFSGLKPISQRVQHGEGWQIKEEALQKSTGNITPKSINPYDLSGISPDVVVTKQLMWERKLLDLSLRNNLLNVRITRNTLQLISSQLDIFEDALADGEEFRVMHKPTDWDNPLFNYGLYSAISARDPILDLIQSELTQKRLRTYLTETELSKALTYLYRSSRTALEENGANTLYIALGLLKWYETSSSERPRYAPILLVPVEIIRKSAAKGYVIRSREEETLMNITLLEMLRQNFNITISGLDPLPTDDSGVDVSLIYSIIRNSIKNQPKWDVEEQAILGLFSFNKFIMWNDIHNNSDKLKENEVVSSLINGKIEWKINGTKVDTKELDKKLSPSDIILPISADSSQLEAIYEAANGKNFILHGPPGTGKSQTITNLIANALYKGKRVLFVAEKMAALSVVQRRLEAINLAPFCLELHSNKIKKSMVMEQLKAVTDVVATTHPDDFKIEAERIFSLRSEMNQYIDALHKEYPFGYSLYDAIVQYQYIAAEPLFTIPEELITNLDKNQLLNWREAVEKLVSVTNACGHPHNHALDGIEIKEYSSTIQQQASKTINRAKSNIYLLDTKVAQLSSILAGHNLGMYKRNSHSFLEILHILLDIPQMTSSLISAPQLTNLLKECEELCIHGRKKTTLKQTILESFSENILIIDAESILNSWQSASLKWFLPQYIEQRKVKRQLKTYAIKELRPNIAATLEDIINYQKEEKFLQQNQKNWTDFFGQYSKEEDWDTISLIIQKVAKLNMLLLDVTKDISITDEIKKGLGSQLVEGIDTFRRIHGSLLTEIISLYKKVEEDKSELINILCINPDLLTCEDEPWIEVTKIKLDGWANNIDQLKDWYQWLTIYRQIAEVNLGFIADQYKANNINTSQLLQVFNKSLYKAIIEYIMSSDDDLQLFKGEIFNDSIEKYKDLVARFEELTKEELYAQLASNLPSFTREASYNSEVGILQRNIRNNARGISIRRLFDMIPKLLPRLCPCMLMSPISVAQYIDVDAEKFDLVVFDEASQMPTYEAVGAIARGKNVVIVGDPKQMPPTNFFSSNSVDEDNIELEDLESILDDCLALSMPSQHLLWHYRSKHESLITFSNSEYYDKKLLTFPSPDNIESKVKHVSVDGFYDKGKTRQNKAEAEAIVYEIVRRLSDEDLKKRSIGVVTFSSVQQSLIENMLHDIYVEDPNLESLALDGEEPLFIKNLENVQGDERDIILFSIGYGPDKEGNVSMNFGPLNRIGGERRLNVAVSRARYEMLIFSTLRSDQIDLNRTSSVGVAGLKRFLEFSERGEHTLVMRGNSKEIEYTISHIIADKLRTLGYKVHTDIGSSDYKIDIGIVDEENLTNYRLGILCDGKNYCATKMVRDREIVQNSVLRMLGWNICRVWTLDWWEDPEKVLRTIIEALEQTNRQPIKKEKPFTPFVPPISKSIEQPLCGLSDFPNQESISSSIPYETAELDLVYKPKDDFFYSRNLILKQINQVVQKEAPISRNLLCKRVLSAWNISRLGQRLDRTFEKLFKDTDLYKTSSDEFDYFWVDKNQYDNFEIFRSGNRDAVDLPPEEIANAMRKILENEVSIPIVDLIRLAAQVFGFARTGSIVDAAMNRGLGTAIQRNYIKLEEDRATII